MIAVVRLAWMLARAGGRLRSGLVVTGAAVATVVLLVAAAVPSTLEHPDDDMRRFVGVVVLVLTMPVVTLLAAVTRLSASVRDRRLSSLRILGVAAGTTRAVAAIEAALLSIAGLVVGTLAFLALRPALARIGADRHWFDAARLWPSTVGWALALAGVLAVSLVVATLPARAVTSSPLAVRRQAAATRPGWWRVVPLLAGASVLTYTITRRFDPDGAIPKSVVLTFFIGTALLGLGLPLAAPVAIRLLADGMVRMTARPSVRLAARRLQQEPAGTNRLVTSLLVALFVIVGARCVLVSWETTPQAVRAEKALHGGPQAAQITVMDRQQVDLDAIRAVPHVSGAAFHDAFNTQCPASAFDCAGVLVARCQDLPALRIHLDRCVEGQPTWLMPWFSAQSGSDNVGHPVTAIERNEDDTKTVAQLRLPAVRATAVQVEGADVLDSNWPQYLPSMLLLPPDYPGAAKLVASQQQRTVSVVLDRGGTSAYDRLASAVQHQNLLIFSEETPADWRVVENYRAILYAIAAVLLSVGLAALLITALDAAVQRRRHLASLSVLGVPLALSRASQLIQVAVPLLVGLPAAAAAGVLAGRAYLMLTFQRPPVPWPSVGVLVGVALLASFAVAGLTVSGLGRAVRAEDLRRE